MKDQSSTRKINSSYPEWQLTTLPSLITCLTGKVEIINVFLTDMLMSQQATVFTKKTYYVHLSYLHPACSVSSLVSEDPQLKSLVRVDKKGLRIPLNMCSVGKEWEREKDEGKFNTRFEAWPGKLV